MPGATAGPTVSAVVIARDEADVHRGLPRERRLGRRAAGGAGQRDDRRHGRAGRGGRRAGRRAAVGRASSSSGTSALGLATVRLGAVRGRRRAGAAVAGARGPACLGARPAVHGQRRCARLLDPAPQRDRRRAGSSTPAGGPTHSFGCCTGPAPATTRAASSTRSPRLDGPTGTLTEPLLHLNYETLAEFRAKQARYAVAGSADALGAGRQGEAAQPRAPADPRVSAPDRRAWRHPARRVRRCGWASRWRWRPS